MNEEIVFDEVTESNQDIQFNDSFNIDTLINDNTDTSLKTPYVIVDLDRYKSDNELLVRLLGSISNYGGKQMNVYARKNNKTLLANTVDFSILNISSILEYFDKIVINKGNGDKTYHNTLEVISEWMS